MTGAARLRLSPKSCHYTAILFSLLLLYIFNTHIYILKKLQWSFEAVGVNFLMCVCDWGGLTVVLTDYIYSIHIYKYIYVYVY